jgi:uncharacterized membrane protein (DUF106 family)
MLLETLIIILVSLAVGISGQLADMIIVDHEVVRASKGKVKELQAFLKTIKREDPKFMETYNQIMAENSKVMKQTMKPTFITFVPFLIVFLIMSSFFSFAPIAVGTPIHVVLSGSVNGTLLATNNCLTLDNSTNVSIISNGTQQTFVSSVNSVPCSLALTESNSSHYNVSLVGLVGSSQSKAYQLGGLKMNFQPNALELFSLPFSIPLIGNQLNWFWVYLIISFLSSITLNRVLIHYGKVA